jgi:DNA-binding LacI/PurR family transcriptional regulator
MTGQEIVKVAAMAECSPRTVQRYLSGHRTLPALEKAIKVAVKRLGFEATTRDGEAE